MPSASGASQPTLLIVDDEPKIRAAVRDAVAQDVGRCLEAGTGTAALAMMRRELPDLVVLDLGLPDIEGVEVCRAIREFSHVPIVVLSARHSEDEKARLLDAGADDYVTKPFGTVEFRARLRAHVRRSHLPSAVKEPIEIGPYRIDLERRTAERGGERVHLTPIEWSLLRTLVANAGRTMTHRQLFRAVWGASQGDAQQYLRVYMGHLRRKLEPDPYAPRHFVTEPGVGYRFEFGSERDGLG
jgi:two-component system, OmpR family, KDP operon response regulator KdpE